MVSNRERLDRSQHFIEKTKGEIAIGEFEGKIPAIDTHDIFCHYQININGEVIGQNGNKMTYHFRSGNKSPFVTISINKKDKEGKIIRKQKEVKITHLMRKYFNIYIKGYKKYKYEPKNYILVPKNGDRNNMKLENLEYKNKIEYNLQGTKKGLLINLSSIIEESNDEEIAKRFGTTIGRANKIRSQLKANGTIGDKRLKGMTIYHSTYPTYLALLDCKGLSSNLELARQLRPNKDFNNKNTKKLLTTKISKVRKILFDKGLIKQYNTYQKTVKIADVKKQLTKALEENKKLSKKERKTHAQLGESLGLDKTQVDNFYRTLKNN